MTFISDYSEKKTNEQIFQKIQKFCSCKCFSILTSTFVPNNNNNNNNNNNKNNNNNNNNNIATPVMHGSSGPPSFTVLKNKGQ